MHNGVPLLDFQENYSIGTPRSQERLRLLHGNQFWIWDALGSGGRLPPLQVTQPIRLQKRTL